MQTRENIEFLAKQARQYAHSLIKKGYTQIATNQYSDAEALALENAIKLFKNYYRVHKNDDIETINYKFIVIMNFIKKYSLGNCGELSVAALNYFIENNIPVRAEIFHISDGDHVFLVINRDVQSEEGNPLTWGSDCIICDPWDDKDFPAEKYLDHLKTYFSVDLNDRRTNFTKPVNIYHQIRKFSYFDNSAISDNSILEVHVKRELTKTNTIMDMISNYHGCLVNMKLDLVEKYGDSLPKLAQLNQKIADIEILRKSLLNLTHEYHSVNNLDEFFKARTAYKINNNLSDILFFSPADKKEISFTNSGNKVKKNFLKLFKHRSKAYKQMLQYEASLRTLWREESEKSIANLPSPKL